jgi:alpha-amylase
MTDVCLIFQVHQPYRLKDFPFDKIGKDHSYENTALNTAILNRISDRCYLPANQILLEAIRRFEGRLKVAFSVSGMALEQFFRYRPDVLESFRNLCNTGCVEFLAETYYHSLAALHSTSEFRRQVVKHEKAIQNLLDVKPTVLRNTELLHADSLLPAIEALGFRTILTEEKPGNLSEGTPNEIHTSPDGKCRILVRNQTLSDAISFPSAALKAADYAARLAKEAENSSSICIYLDYETFGEHQKQESGIQDFLSHLPEEILKQPGLRLNLPSDAALDGPDQKPVYHSTEWTSWADEAKDTSAWCENHMQKDAQKQLFNCELSLLKLGKPELLDAWGRLQSSDHFYYMSTPYSQDFVHQAFNPYESPYDAYLNYMNVLSDFRGLLHKG